MNDEKAGFVKTGFFAGFFADVPYNGTKRGRALEAAMGTDENDLQNASAAAFAGARTQAVWGVGNPQTRVLLVGEAPGKNEDEQGEPFVGRSGQLLDKMLASGRSGSKTEYLYHQYCEMPPAGNRDPAPGGGSGLFRLSAGADPDPGAQDYRMPGQDQRYTDHRPRL